MPTTQKKYGSQILIERNIKSDGTSSFTLRSDKGTVVSRRKSDLISLTDHFNIQARAQEREIGVLSTLRADTPHRRSTTLSWY